MSDWSGDSLGVDGLRSFESFGGDQPTFYTALVQFSANGRCYPVNCPPRYKVGESVLVRMDSLNGQIKSAIIVDKDEFRHPCRNGVVCRESERHWYAGGPSDVIDYETLESFLIKYKWKRYETSVTDFVKYSKIDFCQNIVDFARNFPIAFRKVGIKKPILYIGNISASSSPIFAADDHGMVDLVEYRAEGKRDDFSAEGKIVLSDFCSWGIELDCTSHSNPFEAAAWWAEGSTVCHDYS